MKLEEVVEEWGDGAGAVSPSSLVKVFQKLADRYVARVQVAAQGWWRALQAPRIDFLGRRTKLPVELAQRISQRSLFRRAVTRVVPADLAEPWHCPS
ncbi:hypothetical protein GCM10018781_34710 [Kitasatospora indigofera]|uniref:Uncharacterized protein n=1 Tax=Kitasatospora indigofera TaxID=67307 RepID=A0A919KTV6_9ACTN|nr:hypothetical protein GCM10018781_34710 [Kitasatospora indigofera]